MSDCYDCPFAKCHDWHYWHCRARENDGVGVKEFGLYLGRGIPDEGCPYPPKEIEE